MFLTLGLFNINKYLLHLYNIHLIVYSSLHTQIPKSLGDIMDFSILWIFRYIGDIMDFSIYYIYITNITYFFDIMEFSYR